MEIECFKRKIRNERKEQLILLEKRKTFSHNSPREKDEKENNYIKRNQENKNKIENDSNCKKLGLPPMINNKDQKNNQQKVCKETNVFVKEKYMGVKNLAPPFHLDAESSIAHLYFKYLLVFSIHSRLVLI